MLSTLEWESELGRIALESGLKLFDFELPSAGGGALRVFLWSGTEEKRGATIEECSAFARSLRQFEPFSELERSGAGLEVSSPGVNRKLRLPWHFETALGERVVLRGRREGLDENCTCKGLLEEFRDGVVQIKCEDSGESLSFALHDLRKARVDFDFK